MISVIGLGFVGSAMVESFIKKGYKLKTNLFVYDKFKNGGIGDLKSVIQSNIIFLALPTMYDEDKKTYDTSAIESTCDYLIKKEYSGAVVLKSTIVPETTLKLCDKYKLNFIHNPEFLTARTAAKDYHNQKHIILGKSKNCSNKVFDIVVKFYNNNYPDAEISICESTESESMKIFVNSFYSVKVQIMTEFYLLCQKLGISYDNVRDMMIKNGWMTKMHTIVPGPDGQISYGGLCFPKDTNALNEFMNNINSPNAVLNATITERNMMRNDKDNIISNDSKL